jgi:DNA-directed RNA polymerase subunit E'/Rpb7
MARHAYYERKIKNPSYTKSFEQFKREAVRVPEPVPDWPENGRLPYNISWDSIVDSHVGNVVEGEISNITELGIFVRLCREFTGLIFWKNLSEGFGEKFTQNQRVKVKISKAFLHPRDKRGRIDLRLAEDH